LHFVTNYFRLYILRIDYLVKVLLKASYITYCECGNNKTIITKLYSELKGCAPVFNAAVGCAIVGNKSNL